MKGSELPLCVLAVQTEAGPPRHAGQDSVHRGVRHEVPPLHLQERGVDEVTGDHAFPPPAVRKVVSTSSPSILCPVLTHDRKSSTGCMPGCSDECDSTWWQTRLNIQSVFICR